MNKFSVGKSSVLVLLAALCTVSTLLLVTFGATPVKAVTFPITTTYDFITTDKGMQGNLWATDNFHSTLVITDIGDGDYQIVRTDTGTFESLPGAKSPGGVGDTLIGDGTKGTISGGITVAIKGTLKNDIPATNGLDTIGTEGTYFQRYFGIFFDRIVSGKIESWGWTFTTCNNGTWVDNETTEASYPGASIMGDITGAYVPCPTPAPLTCTGDQHLDGGGVNCVSFSQAGPPPQGPYTPPTGGQVLGASTTSTGRVLGASTLAGTGSFTENLYVAIMAIGGLITAAGAINFKKSSKTVK